MSIDNGKILEWGGDWLPLISSYGAKGVICVAGKNPSPDKIEGYCMSCCGKEGCPNLIPAIMAEAKPEERFGWRKYQVPNCHLPSEE